MTPILLLAALAGAAGLVSPAPTESTAAGLGSACYHNALGRVGVCRRPRDCPHFHQQRLASKDYRGQFCTRQVLCCPPLLSEDPDATPAGVSCSARGHGEHRDLRKRQCEMLETHVQRPAAANASVFERKCRTYLDMEYQPPPQVTFIPGLEACERECARVQPATLVVGGEDAAEAEFPHMALLLEKNNAKPYCAGSLISEDFVLSAAHCYLSRGLEGAVAPHAVILGTYRLEKRDADAELTVAVAARYRHPQYTKSNGLSADILLIRLAESVLFTKAIRPACLHTGDDTDLHNQSVLVSGWGGLNYQSGLLEATKGDAALSDRLQKAQLTVVPRKECAAVWMDSTRVNTRVRNLADDHVCALGASKNGTFVDSCQGDSGGPLQTLMGRTAPGDTTPCSYRVVAVVSTGLGCGTSVPGLYTSVSKFASWIGAVVWPCEQ